VEDEMRGLLGRKVGMTQIFDKDGMIVPVSVIQAGPCPVVQVRTVKKDGYNAIQLAFGDARETRSNLPTLGHFKKAGLPLYKHLQEFRVENPDEFKPGQMIDVGIFKEVEKVTVIGTTKGRGFTGVMKRHKFKGGPKTHGSKSHDVVGSVGSSAYPSRVFKGKRLPGHMGNVRQSTRNLKVVEVDVNNNLILVRGAVPGAVNGIVRVVAAPVRTKIKE
jgi:large subunit ribosomal protein L3